MMYAYRGDIVAKARKNYWLEAELLEQARAALGTKTETETVAEALRRVVEGEELVQLLREARAAFPDWDDPSGEQ